jgi:hypothetical protein
MLRKELIRKLLLTNHLNVPERQMFKEQPIRIDEAKEIVKEELKKHKFFRPITDTWDNTKFYYDGLVIEERGTKYILHEQVSGIGMNLLFDKEDVFDNIDDVIDKYLRPRPLDIDGIKIVE